MAFNWKDYHTAGCKFTHMGKSEALPDIREAFYRSALSRHYYSLYNSASLYARVNLSNFQLPKKNSKHEYVKNFYLNYPDDVVKNISYSFIRDIGKDLDTCKTFRIQADYELTSKRFGLLAAQAELRLKRCLQLIK